MNATASNPSLRQLSADEIRRLRDNHCRAESWDAVLVSDPFDPNLARGVDFAGRVEIGPLPPAAEAGALPPHGLYHSRISNCRLGARVLIHRAGIVHQYGIGEGAAICSADSIVMNGPSAFGNGTEINAWNEAGGREVLIFDRLSAQLAYLQCVCRHRPKLIETLRGWIEEYAASKRRDSGHIGPRARVEDCGSLEAVWIGPCATVRGARRLKNGTLAGEEEAPAFVGAGVDAADFILQTGSSLDSQAIVHSCFVGQGVQLGKQFSAEHSAFFANCEAFHGEACSLFAGPYTVTHHKSTILIAAMVSFYNAGSGSNQSNHMYKLGPVHQGALERGSKAGSFSYLLWPSLTGPFSVVIGKHYANFDASDFPFSYINEAEGRSVLTPAMNLFTAGVLRDGRKWPARDRRKGAEKLDRINFDFWNPYVAERLMRGEARLRELAEGSVKKHEWVNYKGLSIKRLMLKTCRKYYEMALAIFAGEHLLRQLEPRNAGGFGALLEDLAAGGTPALDSWTDAAGWLVPTREFNRLMDGTENGAIRGIEALHAEIDAINARYGEHAWAWCRAWLERESGKPAAEWTREDLAGWLREWADNKAKWLRMIQKDAAKEFGETARAGYGLGGGAAERMGDFEAVRGDAGTHSFITGLNKEIEEIQTRAAGAEAWLNGLPD